MYKIIKIYIKYIKSYWKSSILIFFTIIFISILSLINPIILQKIIDLGLVKNDYKVILNCLCIFIVIFIFKNIFDIFNTCLLTKFRNEIDYDLTFSLIDEIFYKKMNFFDNRENGELIQRVLSEVDHIKILYSDYIISIINQTVLFVLVSIFIFFINPSILIAILLLIPFLVLNFLFFSKEIKRVNREMAIHSSELSGTFENFLTGVLTIKIYRLIDFATNKLKELYKNIIKDSYKLMKNEILYNLMVNIIYFLPLIILFVIGGREVVYGNLSLGEFILVYTYLNKIFNPIISITSTIIATQKSQVAIERYLEMFENSHKIMSEVDIKDIKKITFKNVYFGYENKENVIKNFSYQFTRGDVYYIKGENGSGKSTILNLLYNLYDLRGGEIFINDVDILNIKKDLYGSKINYVNQNINLFNKLTIIQNILLNKSTIKKKCVIDLAKQIDMFNDIFEFELGFESVITRNGDNLSGGQKQKIAILRALCSDPQVLIFDEVTAHLDELSVKKFLSYIDKIKDDKIIIFVSHDEIVNQVCTKILNFNRR